MKRVAQTEQGRLTLCRIKDWPCQDRPREKLVRRGAEYLTDTELLAVVLGTGHPRAGLNAVDVARLVLKRFGSLKELGAAGVTELKRVPGVGEAKATQVKAAIELATRFSNEKPGERPRFVNSTSVYRTYRARLEDLRYELFLVLLLDDRQRRLKEVTVARGTVSSASVHPREVLVHAVREAADGLILLHNHPNGDPNPSEADEEVTRRIAIGAAALGIRLVDHIIVTKGGFVSFSDTGILLQPLVEMAISA